MLVPPHPVTITGLCYYEFFFAYLPEYHSFWQPHVFSCSFDGKVAGWAIILDFKKYIYVFIEIWKHRETERDRLVLHLPFSSNCRSIKLHLNFLCRWQGNQWLGQHLLLSQVHYQTTRSGMEQPELKPALQQESSIAGCALTQASQSRSMY